MKSDIARPDPITGVNLFKLKKKVAYYGETRANE